MPALLAVGLPLAALIVNAAHYLPFVADDALISLRYAQRLLDGHGLTWTDGPPVEGYSNLLWVLLVAALGAVGVDLIVATRVLGIACGLAVMWGLARLAAPITWRRLPGALVPGGIYAASGTAAIWTVGGLEQPLVAAALVWLAVCARPLFAAAGLSTPRALRAGLPAVVLCLTRPDSPLFVVLLAGALVVAHRGRKVGWQRALAVSAAPAAAVLIQVGIRRIYYEDWVPNTAHIKANWSLDVLSEGLGYLAAAPLSYAPALGLAVLGAVAAIGQAHTRRVALTVGLWLLAWCGYVASVGGDIFPAHRQLMAAVACLAVLAALGWPRLVDRGARGGAMAVLGLGAVAGLWALQRHDPQSRRAEAERWEWDGQVIGKVLGAGFGDRAPLIAVNAAGTLPYFSGLPAIDMLGLNDRHIARQPRLASGTLAHDHADGGYVLGLEPDLIFFRTAAGGAPAFVSGQQMRTDKRFRLNYKMTRLEGFTPFYAWSDPYIRVRGPLGLQESADEITVPAWLFGRTVAQPGLDGAIVTRLVPQQAAVSVPIPLPRGHWIVRLEPEHPWVAVDVRGARHLRVSGEGAAAIVTSPSDQPVHLRLQVSHADTPLRAVHLIRAQAPPASVARPGLPPGARNGWRSVRSVTLGAEITTPLTRFQDGPRGWRHWGKGVATGPGPKGLEAPMLHTRGTPSGDATHGRARGPAFEVPPQAWITLKVGGGDARGLDVRLVSAQGPVVAWNGPGKDTMRAVGFDLRHLAGERLWLEIHDAAQGPWGHMRLADAVLHQVASP